MDFFPLIFTTFYSADTHSRKDNDYIRQSICNPTAQNILNNPKHAFIKGVKGDLKYKTFC